MKVTKYSGEVVPFDANSLRHSLTRSGATDEEVDKVYEDIKTHLYDGITTRELYEWAYAALKKQRNSYAARDRKSTRLNSSHVKISYAVFCLKKKNRIN